MAGLSRMRSTLAGLIAAVGALLATGCALMQPPGVPRFRLWGGPGDAQCSADVAQAHAALAAAGAAAGDPAATAAAHAAAAGAMASYHACLARPAQP
jgi:hypothetical protein